jgi:hypothetical protein
MARPCPHPDAELPPAGRPFAPGACMICWLYRNNPWHRAVWDGTGPPPGLPGSAPRALPCVYLGGVLDSSACPCPARWTRACQLHGACTLERCKACPDYEPNG